MIQRSDSVVSQNEAAPRGVSRRRFVQALGLGAVASMVPLHQLRAAAAEAGVALDEWTLVPEDKEIPQRWLDTLTVRGEERVLGADELAWVGLPVGGIGCGQVYLGGDGRLWRWDVDNRISPYNDNGRHYAEPMEPESPFQTAVALRTRVGNAVDTRWLDGRQFAEVGFRGRYPLGVVELDDPASPVRATLTAYSPFVALDEDSSSHPVTVMEYRLTNTQSRAVKAELAVMAENPVGFSARQDRRVRFTAGAFADDGLAGVAFRADDAPTDPSGGRPDVLVADWEDGSYGGWTATGTAFGDSPVRADQLPDYTSGVNAQGSYLVFSHDPRVDGDYNVRDGLRGTLTSPAVTIDRAGLRVLIGGGAYAGQTCLNVLVDGEVVATATGSGGNAIVARTLDLSAYEGRDATIQIVDDAAGGYAYVSVDGIWLTDAVDVVFEDWEKETYEGWTVEGTAFGPGPIAVADIPSYQGDVNAVGSRCVNSHASAPGSNTAGKDAATGRLTSDPFTITHPYLRFRLGGGNHPGQTGLQVVVDGEVVAEATGPNSNAMADRVLGLWRWLGRQAQIVILDDATGGWGNVGVDQLVFAQSTGDTRPLSELPDHGTFAIAASVPWTDGDPQIDDEWLDLETIGRVRPSVAAWDTPDAVFDAPDAAAELDDGPQAGVMSISLSLRPLETQTVRVYLGWHFPATTGLGFLQTSERRWYGAVHDDAADAVQTVHRDIDRLSAATKGWTAAWYDESTLPWWLLDRVGTGLATLATSTTYRLDDGRFHGWEGIYCCAGTCTHVWHYAQAVGRVFPGLERDTRERVDLGVGFRATGEIGMRAEADRGWAADGQAGTVLRIYREHQMSEDDTWLRGVWPKVRASIEWMIQHDAGADGVLDGGQPNTLDATWYGRIAWISGLYVAALRAGEAMARELGDDAFAEQCAALAQSGTEVIERDLWNGEWFIHERDLSQPDSVNTNRGVHIDQVLGQGWAHQVGLPRVLSADQTTTALDSLWRYNFTPRPVEYRDNSPIEGGRTYYDADTHALLMCTWPTGGADEIGRNWSVGYFNEAMNGFEYQAAGHMVAEGLVEKGLLVTRAVHERYRPDRRNPYNEIECGDHYARSMASFGVYLTVLGYEHHGPRGHFGFAPVIQQDDFSAAFTAAGGWGVYRQRRESGRQTSELEARSGRLRVATLRLDVPGERTTVHVRVADAGRPASMRRVPAQAHRDDAGRLVVVLDAPVTIEAGQQLEVIAG
ncbi:GH116 family glycosyl hydrolase [Jiangella muralis]|uniref:GH116 family glycosyl hydrolase n=1 Tax=Jiangella muralis TaxID=702383 RepID=UPI000B13D843|nr:GH116 family glycosyl hydrolase [Jiangella muralis]